MTPNLHSTLALSTLLLFSPVIQAQTTAQTTLTLPAVYANTDTNGTTVLVHASVIAAQPSGATTLALACPSIDYNDATTCGAEPGETLIYGPSTYNFLLSQPPGFIFTQDCSLGGSTTAVCAESASGSEANFPGSSTTSYEASDIGLFTITVTQGASLLGDSAAGATASPGSMGSSAAAAASQTGSSAASGAAAGPAGSSAAATAFATGSSSGAAAAATATVTSGSAAMSGAASASGSSASTAATTSSSKAAAAGMVAPQQVVGAGGAIAFLLGSLFL